MSEVVIFGSINMDIVTFCPRHPRVGETLMGDRVSFLPGGKGANQVLAAARCSGSSQLVGCVGDDSFGADMLQHLASCGVKTASVRQIKGVSTGLANVVVDHEGKNSVIVVPAANAETKAMQSADLLVDTPPVIGLAQLEVPLPEVAAFFVAVRAQGGTTILNPSPSQPLPPDLLQNTSILIVNEHEFADVTGLTLPTGDLEKTLELLAHSVLPTPCCIVTLGEYGAVVLERGKSPLVIAGRKVQAVDTTGAGDCFAGWFAAELGQGQDKVVAARRANIAASISVTRVGAGSSMPTKADVDAAELLVA